MGGGIPKQFRSLCGRPVLWWSMKAFHDENPATSIILVLPEEFLSLWNDFFSSLPAEDQIPHKSIAGGNSRGESVKQGLSLIDNDDSLVAIHDGARPMVSPKIIAEGWNATYLSGAGIPVVPVVDSLRRKTEEGVSEAVDRDDYLVVQTPQVFKTSIIKEAYIKAGEKSYSDDASVAENAGQKISLFSGSYDNIKITNPLDMAIAEVLMRKDG